MQQEWWGWQWCKAELSKRCKAPVRSPLPEYQVTNRHSVFTGWMSFLSPKQQCQSTEGIRLLISSSSSPLFRQPFVDDEFVTRCLHPISCSVRCCSDSKSQICNVIFDVICPSFWLSTYISSPFYMAVHCSWWQSSFVHSCNMAKPSQSLLLYVNCT